MEKLAKPRPLGLTVLVLLAALAALLPAVAKAAPQPLTVSEDPWVLPTTTVGLSSGVMQLDLRNDEAEPVKFESIYLSGEESGQFGMQGSNCSTLFSGESCSVWVWFSPTSAGGKSASLVINTLERPVQEVTVKATAAEPQLTWNPESYDFGMRRVWDGGEQYFQLENTGEAPVSVNNLQTEGPDSDRFWVNDNNCWSYPNGIEPGQSCWVRVYFQPDDTGAFEAEVTATASGSEFSAPLSGEGGRARVEPAANPVAFGAVGVGSAGELTAIALTNEGNLPGAFFIGVIAGGDAGSFELVDENCSGEPVGPGEGCVAHVRFRPQGPGPKVARLALFGEDDAGTMIMLQGEGVPASVSLTPASFDFGTLAAGERGPARSFQLRNDGAAATGVDRVALIGSDPDQFLIAGDACTGAVLAPGEACAVRVRFAPDSAGAFAASLRVSGDAGAFAAVLSGTGTASATPVPPAADGSRPFARNSAIVNPDRTQLKGAPKPAAKKKGQAKGKGKKGQGKGKKGQVKGKKGKKGGAAKGKRG